MPLWSAPWLVLLLGSLLVLLSEHMFPQHESVALLAQVWVLLVQAWVLSVPESVLSVHQWVFLWVHQWLLSVQQMASSLANLSEHMCPQGELEHGLELL